jgi:hypothetical protein
MPAVAVAVGQSNIDRFSEWKPGQGHELELVAHGAQLALELGDGGVVELGLPVEGGEQL